MSIEPENWNAGKGMAKGSRQEMTKLNNFLEQYRSGIVESYRQQFLQKKPVTADLIRSRFVGAERLELTLNKLMEHHNNEQEGKLDLPYRKAYLSLRP